jgi:hypothetical protein
MADGRDGRVSVRLSLRRPRWQIPDKPAGKDEILRNRNRYRAVPVAFDAFMLGTPRVGQLVLSLPDFTQQSSGSKESC